MRSHRSREVVGLLLLLITFGSGQAPVLVLRACARMSHSAVEAPGSTAHHHGSRGDLPADAQVHLCCNLCGLLVAGPTLQTTALGSPRPPLFILTASGSSLAREFHGLGDVPLLPPALGPPVSST